MQANLQERQSADDDTGESGALGKRVFKSVCLSEYEFQGQGEGGGAVRYQACLSEGPGSDTAQQVFPQTEG